MNFLKEIYFFMFISLLVQRNEPKKSQPVTWSRFLRDCPVLLAKNGRLGKSYPLKGYSAETFFHFLLRCSAA
jgi:hypothetical protein